MPGELGTSLGTGPSGLGTGPSGFAAGPSGRVLSRAAAGAGALCAVAHLGMLTAHPMPAQAAALSVLLATACLVCARHLWRRAGAGAWSVHAVLTAAMLALHPLVAGAEPVGAMAGMHSAAGGSALLPAVGLPVRVAELATTAGAGTALLLTATAAGVHLARARGAQAEGGGRVGSAVSSPSGRVPQA